MPDVTKQINLPAGAKPRQVDVWLKLVAAVDEDAFGYTPTGDIGGATLKHPDNSGLVTFPGVVSNLDPDLEPTGTAYSVTTVFDDGGRILEYISVPDGAGPYSVSAILTTAPAGLPPAGATNATMDGDVGGTVGANTINPLAVVNTHVADQNITSRKLVVEDEDGVAFTFDPSGLPDADVLPAPWVDAHDIAGLELLEDRLGIRSGQITQIEFQGPNYTVPVPGDILSGWRSLAYVDCPWSDGFEVEVVLNWSVSTAGGSPAACFDPDDADHMLGTWIVEPLSWYELGPVSRLPGDFHYYDTCPSDLTAIADPTNVTVKLRVVGGWFWSLVDGERKCGPVPVPAGLIGSRRHGIAPDYGDDVADPCIRSVTIRAYDGPVAADYPPPTITGAAALKGTGTSTAVPIPNGAVVDDWMVLAIAGSVTFTTPSGWTSQGSETASGFRLQVFSRKVTGAEAWFGLSGQTLAVTHTSGAVAAHMSKAVDANPHRALTVTLDTDATSDTSATIPSSIVWGRHRATIGIVAVPADRTVTFPTGWTSIATTSPGGDAVTLAVGQVPDWTDPTPPLELSATFTSGGRETGEQVATLSSASTCVTCQIAVGPDQEGAPV